MQLLAAGETGSRIEKEVVLIVRRWWMEVVPSLRCGIVVGARILRIDSRLLDICRK